MRRTLILLLALAVSRTAGALERLTADAGQTSNTVRNIIQDTRGLYIILLLGAFWYFIHFWSRRVERRHQDEIRRLAETKEQEAREARLNFFTMIAHEIRTPVSLIIAPLEKMMKNGTPSDDLRIIDRNAHRLLELVDQLLDFRKVEQKDMPMRFGVCNISLLMHDVCERFEPAFTQSGKTFDVDYPDEHFTAVVDMEAITKVMSNLLTNANKYAKSRVTVRCYTEPDETNFRIEVEDDGVGIREQDKERIFQPFFQAANNKPGTGIGLTIVKNIVCQHNGTIMVDSQLGKGSKFVVVLPIRQNQQPDMTVTTRPSDTYDNARQHAETEQSTAATLLIVDDQQDMLDFLSDHFSNRYNVLTAHDGLEALDELGSHEVELIVCDWMMPKMDGQELCRHVRNTPEYSHIPFVMLTAKTDDDAKVEGMDVGADAYVEKPFSILYLEGIIRNTFEMRRRLRERFAKEPLEPVTAIACNPTDDAFLGRMNNIIEQNLANPDLNVNFLAEQLAISRSGLFAKMKTLANVSPNEMIQIVRLKKAAKLLQENDYKVSEVCYMVGWSNPSYFSKCFQKQFGKKPSEWKDGFRQK